MGIDKIIDDLEKEIKNGEWNRHELPEHKKGVIAIDLWNDERFAFGMEYGALNLIHQIRRKYSERGNEEVMNNREGSPQTPLPEKESDVEQCR